MLVTPTIHFATCASPKANARRAFEVAAGQADVVCIRARADVACARVIVTQVGIRQWQLTVLWAHDATDNMQPVQYTHD